MTQAPENWTDGQSTSNFPAGCKDLTDHLYLKADAGTWGLTRDAFASALGLSARKHFAGVPVSPEKYKDYLETLHLKDLALACACRTGRERAWEYFIANYRDYLRRAAAAILRSSASSPAASDLADSLFADLYGVREGQRAEASLLRYFHGRSSLKTWLRAVLAQRHVDAIRAGRRFVELEEGGPGAESSLKNESVDRAPELAIDPHRERYLTLFTRTLEVALGLLEPRDSERLRLYYAEQLTLAEIGRRLGEHESSVSRNLERTRRELRLEVEQSLRKGRSPANGVAGEAGLSDAQISQCFEYGAQDAPIDFGKLFPQSAKHTANAERKQR